VQLTALPQIPAGFKGPTSKGREKNRGKKEKVKGMAGQGQWVGRGEGRGEEGKGRTGEDR